MTEMLDVSPLSPVREWAISRTFIRHASKNCTVGFTSARGKRTEATATTSRRLPRPSTTGWPVGVKGLDLVSDTHGLRHAVGAADYSDANLVRFALPGKGC